MTNISNISIFSEVRGDTTVKELLEGPVEELQFHQKCYDNYTHTKTLKHIVDRNDKDQKIANETIENSSSSSQRLSTRKRNRSGKYLILWAIKKILHVFCSPYFFVQKQPMEVF